MLQGVAKNAAKEPSTYCGHAMFHLSVEPAMTVASLQSEAHLQGTAAALPTRPISFICG